MLRPLCLCDHCSSGVRLSYFRNATCLLELSPMNGTQGLYLISSNNKEDVWIAKFPFDAF